MINMNVIEIGFYIGIIFGLVFGFLIGKNTKSWSLLTHSNKKRHLAVVGIGGMMIITGLVFSLWRIFI
jgi:nitrate reductase gamma subunit